MIHVTRIAFEFITGVNRIDAKVERYSSITRNSKLNLVRPNIKVADEVFVATALLHREHPERVDFTQGEIVARAEKENLFGELRDGVRVHVSLHCVANRRPNKGRYGMLYETADGRRRLVLAGDDVHPERTGKIFPEPEDVPPQYHQLIDWARKRYNKGVSRPVRWLEGIFQLSGTGKDLWKGEDPDEYVRGLREGWE